MKMFKKSVIYCLYCPSFDRSHYIATLETWCLESNRHIGKYDYCRKPPKWCPLPDMPVKIDGA